MHLPPQNASTQQSLDSYLKIYGRYALDTIAPGPRLEVKVKVAQKWFVTLRQSKMPPQTIFGLPISNNMTDYSRKKS